MLLSWLKKGVESDLERLLGYRFKDKENLEDALTHRSYRFESQGEVTLDNQRLEFLGDAILGFLAAEYVFAVLQDEEEGGLTSFRSQVTSGKALAGIGRQLGIGDALLIGQGEERSGGRRRPSNLADAVEAILAAAYVDGGMPAARKVFAKVFVPRIEALSGNVWEGNPKGELQNIVQRRFHATPEYELMSESGPSHNRMFEVRCVVNEMLSADGFGSSKRAAQAAAAKALLVKIRKL